MAVDKLATYQAERDFTQTREPSGAAAVQPSGKLRFVIRRHAATRLHSTGAGWSGKSQTRQADCPPRIARARSRTACWFVVIEYRLLMSQAP